VTTLSPERLAAVMDLLRQADTLKMPCPSNSQIAERLGLTGNSSASEVLSALQHMGCISIERRGNRRKVTITNGAPIERPVTVGPKATITLEYTDRDPCFLCGVRGDYGCKHRLAA